MEQSTTKKIAKNFSWLSVGDIVSRGLNFLAIIYIARVLGAVAFGWLNFAQAFLAYLVLLVDSGFSLYGTREIAKAKERAGVISLNFFALRFMIAAVVFTLAFIILLILPLSFGVRLLFAGTFLFVFYRAVNTDWVFQGLEKMENIALARVLFSVLSFIFIVLIIRSSEDLIKVPFIYFVTGLISAAMFLYVLFRYITPANFKHLVPSNWWNYFSEAIPLGASVILIQIYYNMDTIMLGFMDRLEVVGYYNAAYKMFLVILGFLGIWQSTAFPVMSKRLMKDKMRAQLFINKYTRLTLLAVVPAIVLIVFLSPYIIRLFFGLSYAPSSLALQILSWNMVLIAVSGVCGVLILIPLGKSRQFLYGVGSGALVNIVLNLILIPPFSYIGAAIATLISEAMVTVIMFYFVRKEIQLNIFVNLRIPVIASSIASIFFLVFIFLRLPFLWLVGGIFFFAIAYPGLVLFFGEKEFLLEFYQEILRKE